MIVIIIFLKLMKLKLMIQVNVVLWDVQFHFLEIIDVILTVKYVNVFLIWEIVEENIVIMDASLLK